MKSFEFGEDFSVKPADPLIEGVSISPITSPLASGSIFQAAIFRFEPGAVIHRHPASTPQIIAVLSGRGEVAGGDGMFQPLEEGRGVFFAKGEEHETRTDEGMTALIMEGQDLRPFGWRGDE